MTRPEHEVLDRFHRVLVDEIRRRKPEYLSEPFTVAEIYQDLVPYHTHRDRIGVRMNGDYEDALLRLLAGEEDRLKLDSDPARRDFLAELKNAEPNTGIYRDFAAVAVRLNPDRIPAADAAETNGAGPAVSVEEGPDVEEDREVGDVAEEAVEPEAFSPEAEGDAEAVAGEAGGDEMPETEVEGGGVAASAEPSRTDEEEEGGMGEEKARTTPRFLPDGDGDGATDGATTRNRPVRAKAVSSASAASGSGVKGDCVWCNQALPDRPDLVFCPHCGGDSRLIPCPACGTELQADWSYCIACGEHLTG